MRGPTTWKGVAGGRSWTLCAALAALVLLPGCAAFPFTHEIEGTILMQTMGVDVGTATVDGVAVTAASAARPGAGTQQGEPAVVLSAQADTISAACQRMQGYGDRFVFYGDVEQMLVGEALAERSLTALLGHMGRDRALRLEAQVWVIRGGAAADVLFAGAQGDGATDRLSALEEDAGLFSASLPKTAREALVELSENGSTFLPALALVPSRPGDGAQGETAIVSAGYSLFRDGSLVSYTDPQVSRGMNLLLGRVDTDLLELITPDCGRVALKINGARTTLRPRVERGVLVGLAVACHIQADVAERRGVNPMEEETLSWLESALAETTRKRMSAAVAQLQTLDADCLGLGARAALSAPWHKALLAAQWQAGFSTLAVDIQVEATIARE